MVENIICLDLFLNNNNEIKQIIAIKRGKIDVKEKKNDEILPKSLSITLYPFS